ncbi:MAG: DMT family transporter [Gammaproteobacteria bacterium]|nr:DMT family transporter [Gammaproteobacteria bacterium]MCP4090773.1 DMT family transporter [Gammaproteobacteria bacterium]MCP4277200.1 DMT family transporter [Gammaproteobacteria bacterium]MCP4832822.1 DMT family transporter [Gammaproteobacteria bacterium]MCP4927990.1 DMT family transporter [Gammaproteobacteria bacterium]
MVNVLLFILTVLIWGATWYAIEFQLGVVAVEVSLAYRYLLAAALAFSWCMLRRKSLRFGWAAHKYFVLLGLFLFGLNYLSAYHAQIYISSALNAIGFSAMIWMNILNARLFFGTTIAPRIYIGAAMGIAGIIIIFWPEIEEVSLSDTVVIGAIFSLLGALIASFGNIVSQAAQQNRIPVMQANAWGMFYGAILNGGLALLQGRAFNFDTAPSYTASLLFLAVFGSVVAFACYLTLLGRVGLERAGYAAVMVPVVALLLSAILEDMPLDAYVLSGMALAVFGNIFILAPKSARP